MFADGPSKDQVAVILHTHTQPPISHSDRLHMFRNTRDVNGVMFCGLHASMHGS